MEKIKYVNADNEHCPTCGHYVGDKATIEAYNKPGPFITIKELEQEVERLEEKNRDNFWYGDYVSGMQALRGAARKIAKERRMRKAVKYKKPESLKILQRNLKKYRAGQIVYEPFITIKELGKICKEHAEMGYDGRYIWTRTLKGAAEKAAKGRE